MHRHRTLPSRAVAVPDRATPPTWRVWKARTSDKRWYWRYPLAAEWALEWFVYWLRSLALFDLLELAGKLTVLVAVVVWFLEADQRARQAEEAIKARHYRAWELINAARGSTGDGGRRDALQDLTKDRVSLATAPLEQAYLPRIDLQRADLELANLEGANLPLANLQDANLWGANLQGANLWGAWVRRADLRNANLEGANLEHAYLKGAGLGRANLQGANLQGAYLYSTSLQDARNLTQEQLDAARGDDQTTLPASLTRPAHWPKTKRPEAPSATQPSAAERAPPAAGAPGPNK